MGAESFLIANAVKRLGISGLRAVALRLAKGENLWKLSKTYNVSLAQLRAIDGILPAVLAYSIEQTEAAVSEERIAV